MRKQNTEHPFVDIATGYNNGVFAVYLVGKDFLEVENRPDLLGVPFLVWNGSWTPIGPSTERAREIVGVPYLSNDQFKRMKNGMITEGNLPRNVDIRGTEYSIDQLASGYVPYSFGVGHQYDEEGKRKVRSLSDFRDLVVRVMPEVDQLRQDRAETRARDETFMNITLALFGLYTPASFTRYQPSQGVR